MRGGTIAALATAPGLAGVAVIRVSGPEALEVADRLLKKRKASTQAAGTFFLAALHHPKTAELVDRAMVLVFHAPHSYTGETTVEFQCHGGSQSPARVLAAVLAAGARLARSGEFTERAFLNGRMDLTQAEGVLDLLNARTERAAVAAQEQLAGRLRTAFDNVYAELLETSAVLEHHLDFNEDELPPERLAATAKSLAARIDQTAAEIAQLLATFEEGHLLRDGATVVIAGPPNAGKSSLLNALLGRERAIVTPVAGTTRDTLEESFNLRGIPVRLVDTAGLRETTCPVEALGIGRTRRALQTAEAILYVLDVSAEADLAALRELPPERTLVLWNKVDLVDTPQPPSTEARPFFISALKPDTLKPVLEALHGVLLKSAPEAAGACISARHRQVLVAALEHCHAALPWLEDPAMGWVIAASGLRQAAEEVATLTGRRYSEDLLERIFSRFCVGK